MRPSLSAAPCRASSRSPVAHHERTQRLFAQQAATAQQLDQAERDDRVLEDQIKAQDEQIEAQERQIAAQTRPDRRRASAAADGRDSR